MKKLLLISLCLFNFNILPSSSNTDLALQATILNRLRQIHPSILNHYIGQNITTLDELKILEAIDKKLDRILGLTLLGSILIAALGIKIGYEVGSYYGSLIGKKQDDLEAPKKLELIKEFEEKSRNDTAENAKKEPNPLANLLVAALCPPLYILMAFTSCFKITPKAPDLHEHEKKDAQEYGETGAIIGCGTGFIGTLLLGAYIMGKISLPKL